MEKFFSKLLVFILVLSMVGSANGVEMDREEVTPIKNSYGYKEALNIGDAEKIADLFNVLGLLQGSEKGYELDKQLTRAEGITLIRRLVATDEQMVKRKVNHPFKDVPLWASHSVGFMYNKGMTTGISKDKFGSDKPMSAKDFTTFILRVLRYDDIDDNNKDFTWDTSLDKAVEIGLYSDEYMRELKSRKFLRKDAVYIMKNALTTTYKDSTSVLISELRRKKIIDAKDIAKIPELTVKNVVKEGKFKGKGYSNKGNFGEYKDKKFVLIDRELYLLEGNKVNKLYDKVVNSFIIDGDTLYMIMMDGKSEDLYKTNNTGLYKANINDLNNITKIKDLRDDSFYELKGVVNNKIYYFTITRSKYGVGNLFGDIDYIDLGKLSEIKLVEDIYLWDNLIYNNKLFYTNYGEGERKYSGLTIMDLNNGNKEVIRENNWLSQIMLIDNSIICEISGEIVIYDINTKNSIVIYSGMHGFFYGFYGGWMYFKNYDVSEDILRLNIYSGEVEIVYEHENGLNVEDISVNKDGLYLLLYDDNLVYTLYKTDLDGGNKVKLK